MEQLAITVAATWLTVLGCLETTGSLTVTDRAERTDGWAVLAWPDGAVAMARWNGVGTVGVVTITVSDGARDDHTAEDLYRTLVAMLDDTITLHVAGRPDVVFARRLQPCR